VDVVIAAAAKPATASRIKANRLIPALLAADDTLLDSSGLAVAWFTRWGGLEGMEISKRYQCPDGRARMAAWRGVEDARVELVAVRQRHYIPAQGRRAFHDRHPP
jgi:hypothetical protein